MREPDPAAVIARLDAVVERLDTLAAILQLAHHGAIATARQELRSDPICAAVLETADDWASASALQTAARAATSASERTVRSRIRDLVTRRALSERGSGPTRQYRATGLV